MPDAPRTVPPSRSHGVTFGAALRVWAYVGVNSFGGPAGQIAVMHRELVEGRRWLSERRFLHALNYCMLLPGPEAQQLATYVGWLMHGVPGGVAAGVLFVLPGFVAMLALSVAYAVWGSVTWVSGLLLGIQAAVVAIVVQAAIRIGRRTLRGPALQAVAGASFVALALFAVPFPVVVVAAGLIGWLVGRRRPRWIEAAAPHEAGAETSDGAGVLLPDDEHLGPRATWTALRAAAVCAVLWLVPVLAIVLTLGSGNVFAQEATLFSKSAVVTFGGAYAVLGYIAQQAVQQLGWISANEMIVGLGLAETTPGPLIMVLEFVGFLAAYENPGALPPVVAGTLGAVLTVWVTFVPCFLFIFLGAPYVERLRSNVALGHALAAVSAAVAGVVVNLAAWFALHTAFGTVDERTYGPLHVPVPDWSSVRPASLLVSALALVAVFRLRWGTLRVLGLAAVVGAVLAVTGLVPAA